MKGLIELTYLYSNKDGRKKVLLRTSEVCAVYVDYDGRTVVVTGGETIHVKEPYGTVKARMMEDMSPGDGGGKGRVR